MRLMRFPVLLAVMSLLTGLHGTASALTPGERLYNTIKAMESGEMNFPLPTPKRVIHVGTLDAATGAFTWGERIKARQVTETLPGTGVPGGPPHPLRSTRTVHSVFVSAVKVELRFDVKNAPGAGNLDLSPRTVQGVLPETGREYKIISAASGKVVDVAGVSVDNGAAVHQWDYVGGANQRWRFEALSGPDEGWYRIVAVHSGKVLDVGGISRDNGAAATQWDWVGGDNQKWKLLQAGGGTFVIQAKHSGKVLDLAAGSTDNGARLQQWDRHDGPNQRWILETDNVRSLFVDPGRNARLSFSVRSGPRSSNEELEVSRPRIIGAGAFKIAALPVGIVYAPPQGPNGANYVTFEDETTVGGAMRVSFAQGEETTTGGFSSFGALVSKAGDIKDVVSKFTEAASDDATVGAAAAGTAAAGAATTGLAAAAPYAMAAVAAIKLFCSGLGSVDARDIHAGEVTEDQELVFRESSVLKYPTVGGPGVGDLVCFRRDPKFLWLADDGNVTLTMIDPGLPAQWPIKDLREDLRGPSPGRITGLPHDVLRALCALDPFNEPRLGPAWEPSRLTEPRFVQKGENQFAQDGPIDWKLSFSTESGRSRSQVNSETKIEQHKPGWLSFLGIGEQEDKTIKTFSSYTTIKREIEGSTQSFTAHFDPGTLEKGAIIRAYYDTLFGTVVFARRPMGNPARN